jgi:hypothetical protein
MRRSFSLWMMLAAAAFAGAAELACAAPLLLPAASSASPSCVWKQATLKAWDGYAYPVQVCRDARGAVEQIQASAYPGNPRMDALSALLGLPPDACQQQFDVPSRSITFSCRGPTEPFLGSITGMPGAQALWGAWQSAIPVSSVGFGA